LAKISQRSVRSKRITLLLEGALFIAGITILMAVVVVYLLALEERPAEALGESAAPSPTLGLVNASAPGARSAMDIPPTYVAPERPLVAGLGTAQFPVLVSADQEPRANVGRSGGQPVRIVIPALGVDAPVEPVAVSSQTFEDRYYAQWIVPDRYAAGWHVSSAPLGQAGNTVLNGHNNVHGAIFRDLIDLSAGDEIILYDDQKAHKYEVSEQVLLEERGQSLQTRSQNARFMLPSADERLTLVSCWPRVSSTHRLIVIAHPVDESG
jgi:LPXTG-site transpeptidase (sortase) family protein